VLKPLGAAARLMLALLRIEPAQQLFVAWLTAFTISITSEWSISTVPIPSSKAARQRSVITIKVHTNLKIILIRLQILPVHHAFLSGEATHEMTYRDAQACPYGPAPAVVGSKPLPENG
jgi:hypothetical protein